MHLLLANLYEVQKSLVFTLQRYLSCAEVRPRVPSELQDYFSEQSKCLVWLEAVHDYI